MSTYLCAVLTVFCRRPSSSVLPFFRMGFFVVVVFFTGAFAAGFFATVAGFLATVGTFLAGVVVLVAVVLVGVVVLVVVVFLMGVAVLVGVVLVVAVLKEVVGFLTGVGALLFIVKRLNLDGDLPEPTFIFHYSASASE